MKDRSVILTMILVAGVLVSACMPVTAPGPAQIEQPSSAVAPSPTLFQAEVATTPTATSELATATVEAPTETPAPPPQATSRGDKLEATAPSTVSLASGGLQLVEFFRFT